MTDSTKITTKCSNCNVETSIPSSILSEKVLCTKCQKEEPNQHDHIDSFDFDQGFNLDEVYD